MSPDHLEGLRVLIVEDDAIVAMLVEDIVMALGCLVVGPVACVEKALATLKVEDIDAAILDINLDGERSYAVADDLIVRATPFAFVTGYGVNGLDPRYRDRPVVQKPFTKDALARVLRTLASERGTRRAPV